MIKEEKKLNPLIFIIVIDLVLGGSGRIFTFGPLTLRYILFFIAMLYFFIMVITKNIVIKHNIFYRPIIVFLLFLLISIANGVISGYPISNVLSTFQGYLYILLIFPFSFTINTIEQTKYLMEILYKATLLLALFSIILFVSLTIFPFQTYYLINPVKQELREPPTYNGIIEAIANGASRLKKTIRKNRFNKRTSVK